MHETDPTLVDSPLSPTALPMPTPSAPAGPVVAAGLSPAWQVIMRFPALLPGEVNRASETTRCASGKVLNVAVALSHLGAATRAVTVLGGAPAAPTAAEMAAFGIELLAVPTRGETRTCTTLLDDARGETTELVENAGPLPPDELATFVGAYRAAVAGAAAVVLSGSLPAGTPAGLYRELLDRTACPAILDARGAELLEALPRRPLLVKPNREELAKTVGHSLDDERQVIAAMESLRERGAAWVLVTDGARPALAIGPEGRFRVVPPRMKRVVNPIGCGDCLAAGFAAGIAAGREPLDAFRLGFAAAADNCRTLLAGRLDRGRVAALSGLVTIERA